MGYSARIYTTTFLLYLGRSDLTPTDPNRLSGSAPVGTVPHILLYYKLEKIMPIFIAF